jgi:hypothetical protein
MTLRFLTQDCSKLSCANLGHAMAEAVSGLSPRRSNFDPGSLHVGFVVDKGALGQVLSEYFGFPLSVSVHRCFMTRKNGGKKVPYLVCVRHLFVISAAKLRLYQREIFDVSAVI